MFDKTNSDSNVLAELGSRIERLRLNQNITQAALAREAGISQPTLQRIESGKSAQMKSYIRVLRGLDLIANLDALIPPALLSPMQQLKTKNVLRQRASGSRKIVKEDPGPWSWEEEL